MAYQPPLNGRGFMSISTAAGGATFGGALISSGTINLVAGNNMTLSQAGNNITLSAAAGGGGAGSNTFGMYSSTAGGTTAGTAGSVSGSNVQLMFVAGSNISLSQSLNGSSGSITIHTPNRPAAIVANGGTASSGSVSFSNSPSVSFGMNGNTLTASAAAAGLQAVSGGTTNTNGITGLSFDDGGGVLFGLAGNTLTASIPNGGLSAGVSTGGNSSGNTGLNGNNLVLVGGQNISLFQSTNVNGATVTIDAPSDPIGRFAYPENGYTYLTTPGQSSLSLQHFFLPSPLVGTAAKIGGSLNVSTSNAATTMTVNASLRMGIYAMTTNSSLTLLASGSANNSFVVGMSNSSSNNSTVTGMRQMTVPMNINMTPGEYWMGAVLATQTNYANGNLTFSIYGNPNMGTNAIGAFAPIGSNTTAGRDAFLFQGIYTAQTTGVPNAINSAGVNNAAAGNVGRAAFHFNIFSATY